MTGLRITGAADSVCSLPRLRGRGGEGVNRANLHAWAPPRPPPPPPATGTSAAAPGGTATAARASGSQEVSAERCKVLSAERGVSAARNAWIA
jgi:hypothetical protein